jgi:hypothetical protein
MRGEGERDPHGDELHREGERLLLDLGERLEEAEERADVDATRIGGSDSHRVSSSALFT